MDESSEGVSQTQEPVTQLESQESTDSRPKLDNTLRRMASNIGQQMKPQTNASEAIKKSLIDLYGEEKGMNEYGRVKHSVEENPEFISGETKSDPKVPQIESAADKKKAA